jgi:uroporphyrinogen III methyltransferase/synthase
LSIEGKHILSTRPGDYNDEFEGVLISHGAYIESFPTIKISPVEDKTGLDDLLSKLNTYDGIFFTSVNGVKYFFERAIELGKYYEGKIYVVGIKTNMQLQKFGYKAAFMPQKYSADDMLDEINLNEINGKKLLFPCGNLSAANINEKLGSYSEVVKITVYNTLCPNYQKPHIDWIKEILKEKGVDCISFFSPSGIDNFNTLIGNIELEEIDIAVIGNTTLRRAKEFGFEVGIVPNRATLISLANSIIDFYSRKN